MRTDLERIEGRQRFRGRFVRTGVASKGRFGQFGIKQTLLLEEVCLVETNELVTDHLWFNMTKGFDALCLSPGDYVEFDARVGVYEKGYGGGHFDLHLTRPTKVGWVAPPEEPPKRHEPVSSGARPCEPEVGSHDLAKLFGIKVSQVRRASRRGFIPPCEPGRVGLHWKESQIEAIRLGLVKHGLLMQDSEEEPA